MSHTPDALCLSVSPALRCFNRPLLRELSNSTTIAHWEYSQSPDEPCSLDTIVVLLHDYLKSIHRPVHLIGHGFSGTVALLYARLHPERVRSLSLLSVGACPSIDWQAHYYVQRHLFTCSRTFILAQVVNNLFGSQCPLMTKRLVAILEEDLDTSPSGHSICGHHHIAPGGVSVPMMVGRGEYDIVVDPNALEQWQTWFKDCDSHWECTGGLHFFHYSHPHRVARQIREFWNSLTPQSSCHTPSSKGLAKK